jgi:hypothetical protein
LENARVTGGVYRPLAPVTLGQEPQDPGLWLLRPGGSATAPGLNAMPLRPLG